MSHEIHPIANIFPSMSDSEFQALKADIEQYGQREPVWLYEDKVIDGRHRLRACEELGLPIRTEIYDGFDATAFVVSLNLKTRSLGASDRAAVAARLVKVGGEMARERSQIKADWIAAARREFNPGPKSACEVCGKYTSVCHAHHLFPLHTQFEVGRESADHSFCWLCPTHHAAVHRVLADMPRLVELEGFTAPEMASIWRVAMNQGAIQ